MRLTPPTQVLFLIALAFAVLGVLKHMGKIKILPVDDFWFMTIAYGLLIIGILFPKI